MVSSCLATYSNVVFSSSERVSTCSSLGPGSNPQATFFPIAGVHYSLPCVTRNTVGCYSSKCVTVKGGSSTTHSIIYTVRSWHTELAAHSKCIMWVFTLYWREIFLGHRTIFLPSLFTTHVWMYPKRLYRKCMRFLSPAILYRTRYSLTTRRNISHHCQEAI